MLAYIVNMTHCGSLWYCRNAENKRIFHKSISALTFNVYGQDVRFRFCILFVIQIHLNNSNMQMTISVYTVQCLVHRQYCQNMYFLLRFE